MGVVRLHVRVLDGMASLSVGSRAVQAAARLWPAHKVSILLLNSVYVPLSLSPFCLPKLVCVNGTVPVRHLNLHEYQSKRLMEQYGCNTQSFKIATTVQEAQTAISELGIVGLYAFKNISYSN